jgi:hypothetical protein
MRTTIIADLNAGGAGLDPPVRGLSNRCGRLH